MARRGVTTQVSGDQDSAGRPRGIGPDPRERPLGPDEPSAPVDVPPDLPRPDLGPDVPPGDPQGPDLGA